MTAASDRDEVRCPLPVIRIDWDVDSFESVRRLARCDEALEVLRLAGAAVHAGGLAEETASWRVECHAGHVLLLPDDQASGSAPEFDSDLMAQAVEALRHRTTAAHRAALDVCEAIVAHARRGGSLRDEVADAVDRWKATE